MKLRLRLPAWFGRVPWRWILVAKILLAFATWYWGWWDRLCDGLEKNVGGFEQLAEFEVYPR